MGPNALQESGDIRTRVAATEANGAEQLESIGVLMSQKRDLLDDNRCLKQQLVTVVAEQELHADRTWGARNPSLTGKVELMNAREALRVLEDHSFADGSALRSAIQERVCAKTKIRRHLQSSKLRKGLPLLRLTNLSGIPVTCRPSRLRCKNV